MHKHVLTSILSIAVFLTLVVLLLPASQRKVLSYGVDSYNTHRLVFGDRVFSQEITSNLPIAKIGIIGSDIRQSGALSPIHVEVVDDSGNMLATSIIKPTKVRDDRFAYAPLAEPVELPNGKGVVRIRVPESTINTALGWRYDPSESSLHRYENGVIQDGSFAVALHERVPRYQALYSYAKREAEPIRIALYVTVLPLAFGLLATRIGWRNISPQKEVIIKWSIVCILVIAAFSTRMYAQSKMGGVSGGDPYNYLLISQSLVIGENPFDGAKRLPGYPLLLAPTILWPQIDAHVYMRTLSSLAAMGTVIFAFVLTRKLRLTWPAQLFTVIALAWQPDFFATSLRPEPYSLFGFLLIASLVLFFHARTKTHWVLFGIALGYAAMVRQEGFVLAAIFGVGAVVREVYHSRKQLQPIAYKKLLWMFGPAALLVLPFFVSNTVLYGNPLYTPYFEGEKLEIVDSVQAFHDASISTWSIISSTWKPSWVQEELLLPYDNALIPLVFLATIVWWVTTIHTRPATKKLWLRVLLIGIGIATTTWASYLILTDIKDAARFAPMIVTGVLLVAPALFLVKTGWKGIFILVILLSQLLIATWFHPYAKHYQQSYPFIIIMIAATLFSLPKPLQRYRVTHTFTSIVWLAPFTITLFILYYSHLHIFIDAHNAAAALDSVQYRAVRAAMEFPGPYAYNIDGNLPSMVYNTQQDRRFIEEQEAPDDVNVVIITGEKDATLAPIGKWETHAEFLAAGKDDIIYQSTVYTRN